MKKIDLDKVTIRLCTSADVKEIYELHKRVID